MDLNHILTNIMNQFLLEFYQGYLLPYKFGIDKRILHYSTLIISGQISREEALKNIQNKHAYPNDALLNEDKEYFLKK